MKIEEVDLVQVGESAPENSVVQFEVDGIVDEHQAKHIHVKKPL